MTPAPKASKAIIAALKGYEPTDEQREAIAHPLEPAFLVAGAGSGKTAIMAARIAWAIEAKGFDPSQILGLTFTNKAAEELESRVRRSLAVMEDTEDKVGEVTVQTYHAFAAALVREHGLLVGVEPESGLLTEAQQWQLVGSCIDELPPFESLELRSSAGLVAATLQLASSLADHVLGVAEVRAAAERVLASTDTSEDMRDTAAKRIELCSAVEAYTKAKKDHKRIDFGDQVTSAVEILESFPEVTKQLRDRFPMVLLDEYQDTNVAQRRMIEALVGKGGAVTAVGDARQAIYAFRGATMYNLIGFPEHFPRADRVPYQHISLSENFRSGSNILDVANRVVDRIEPSRRPGNPLRPNPANGTGRVVLGMFEDEAAEAAWIADRCNELHGSSVAEGRDPVMWRDMAILVRRKAAMDAVIKALEDKDVPVEVVGLGGLLKTPEVIEIVAWIRCLETKPSANRWLARVLLGPRWRIHYRDLALCARWAANRNQGLKLRLAGGDEGLAYDMEPGDVGFALVECLDHLGEVEGLGDEARRRLGDFSDRLGTLRKKVNATLLELVQEIIAVTGIADALAASPTRAAAAARQNVANFLDYVAQFSPVEGEATLRSFIAYLEAADDAEETLEAAQPADSDSVKLMTVHGAKGLEFECVFVPSVASRTNKKGDKVYSIFPNDRASNPLTSYRELPYEVREDAPHLPQWTGKLKDFEREVKERAREDERRLFYVALTRAKQYLAVSAAWWYGRDPFSRGSSLFWDEMREMTNEGLVDLVVEAEEPEENPLFEALEAERMWPPQPRLGEGDDLFPEGWGAAADALVSGTVSPEDLIGRLDAAEALEAQELVARFRSQVEMLAAAGGAERSEVVRPNIVSATDFAKVAAGRMSIEDLTRTRLEKPTDQRYLGTEIHRLIEERSFESAEGEDPGAFFTTFPDETELDEPAEPEERAALEAKLSHWDSLGYGDRVLARLPSGQPMVELPFALRRDGTIIRGRIDAVFETGDGGLEIVDWKSGQRFEVDGPDQLGIYAAAIDAIGLVPEGAEVRLTYAFLDGEPPLSRIWER